MVESFAAPAVWTRGSHPHTSSDPYGGGGSSGGPRGPSRGSPLGRAMSMQDPESRDDASISGFGAGNSGGGGGDKGREVAGASEGMWRDLGGLGNGEEEEVSL